MFRPQFPFAPAPKGYTWQPCLYQFDETNIQALGNIILTTGQETGDIPLPLDQDAPFMLMAVRIESIFLNVKLRDPDQNELMEDYIDPNEWAARVPLFANLEGPGIECPAGAVFNLRLQGQ